jgi:uncharacterized membrane protein YbhN (UPF0104 family)
MASSRKQIITFLLRLLITTVLLIWVFRRVELRELWQTVKAARWELLIAVWALTLLYFWLNSVKLQFILKKQSCHARVATIFGASAVVSFYGMIVPGIFSTAAKWYILRKETGKGSTVFSSMLYNQLSIVVVMMVLGLIALMVSNPTSIVLPDVEAQWVLPVVCGLLLAAIILIFLSVLNSRTGGAITKTLLLLVRPFPARIRRKAQETLEQIAAFQTAGVRFHLAVVCITVIASGGMSVLTYILAAEAAGVDVPTGVLVWLFALVYILGRIPISVANLGVREVTLVGVLTIYGVEESAAFLMSIVLFSCLVLMAVIGALYQFCWPATAGQPTRPPQ